jgi:hypothetical protein
MIECSVNLAQVEERLPQFEMNRWHVSCQGEGAPKTFRSLAIGAQLIVSEAKSVPCVKVRLIKSQGPAVLGDCLPELGIQPQSVGMLCRKGSIVGIARHRFAEVGESLSVVPFGEKVDGGFYEAGNSSLGKGGNLRIPWAAQNSSGAWLGRLFHAYTDLLTAPREVCLWWIKGSS